MGGGKAHSVIRRAALQYRQDRWGSGGVTRFLGNPEGSTAPECCPHGVVGRSWKAMEGRLTTDYTDGTGA